MAQRKIVGAIALTAALAGGGLAGATLGIPGVSGAQDNPTTTTTAPGTTSTTGQKDSGRGGRFGGGAELEAAAKALGMTDAELRTALKDGKSSIADVAASKGVDKQKVIDAMVAAGTARLDEAKATLPDRMAKAVDRKFPALGDRGGRGFGGQGFEAAAKALGISTDDLKTALKDGKSIADVAADKGVDKQKVIDAMVADAKTHLADEVKDGRITQEQADTRSQKLTEWITSMIDRTGGGRGPGGHGPGGRGGPGGPDAPADGETGGN